MAYRSGGATRQQLTWFDRNGKELGVMGTPDENSLRNPRLSPDGRRVAVSRTVLGNQDLWLIDGARTSRLTFDAGSEGSATWSPDGRRLAFRSTRNATQHLFVKDASGAGVETPLPGSDHTSTNVSDWSIDGRFLLYQVQGPQTDFDLWVLPMVGEPKPRMLVQTPFRDRQGRFSPDGRWVAYMSDESGRGEIYLRPFAIAAPAATANASSEGRWQVSTEGGVFPVWRPDGRELYYIEPNAEMMAVSIAIRGAAPELGTPMSLFPTGIYGGGLDNLQGVQYDVASDGRFLINTVLDDAAPPITLIQNWRAPETK